MVGDALHQLPFQQERKAHDDELGRRGSRHAGKHAVFITAFISFPVSLRAFEILETFIVLKIHTVIQMSLSLSLSSPLTVHAPPTHAINLNLLTRIDLQVTA